MDRTLPSHQAPCPSTFKQAPSSSLPAPPLPHVPLLCNAPAPFSCLHQFPAVEQWVRPRPLSRISERPDPASLHSDLQTGTAPAHACNRPSAYPLHPAAPARQGRASTCPFGLCSPGATRSLPGGRCPAAVGRTPAALGRAATPGRVGARLRGEPRAQPFTHPGTPGNVCRLDRASQAAMDAGWVFLLRALMSPGQGREHEGWDPPGLDSRGGSQHMGARPGWMPPPGRGSGAESVGR